MANFTINTRLIVRNDTAANWITANPILLKGEMGVEIDTHKFKFGDGVLAWSALDYAASQSAVVKTTAPTGADSAYDLGTIWVDTTNDNSYIIVDNTTSAAVWNRLIAPKDLASLGGGDMLKAQFATNAKENQGYVDKAVLADTATAFATGRTISVSGDVTGTSATFDGTANATIPVTLADSGVTAGTYPKVTVDSKGRVTTGAALVSADIPDLTLSKITDAGSAAGLDVGTNEGDIPLLGPDGKLPASAFSSISLTNVFEVATEAAMLALEANTGDVAVRSDVNKSFILSTDDPTVLDNWVELLTPTDTVLSVNGQIGAVTLTTTNVAEGTNQYYTEARATANFDTNIALANSTDLADSATILRSTDTYVMNGGNA